MLRLLSVLFIASLLQSCSSTDEDNLPRYNVVWIVAEDLSPILPPYGDSTITTPHISRLAAEGITYDNAYSPSGVCAPSRAALATGCYPTRIAANHMRTGPWFGTDFPQERIDQYRADMKTYNADIYQALPPAGVKMMSEHLRAYGYYCTNNSKQDYQMLVGSMAWDQNDNQAHWRNRSDKNQPFFSIFNLNVTHESQVWQRANDTLLVDPNIDVPVPPYLPTTPPALNDIRRVYSNIKLMDAQVGDLISQLEEDGLLDNTIIWYYGDHGGPLPRQKRLTYDSGLRVPLIIRHPDRITKSARNKRLVSFIDFGATVMSQLGITPPDNIDGKPFDGEFIHTPAKYIHAAADRFDEKMDHIRTVRDDRYKYIRYLDTTKSMLLDVAYRNQMAIMQELHRLHKSDQLDSVQSLWFRETKPYEELFDTQSDPHEIVDLSSNPAYRKIKERLSAELDRWINEKPDLNIIPESQLLDKLLPGGSTPITTLVHKLTDGVVTISSSTTGASLGYRIINSNHNQAWSIYKSPIHISQGDTIQVIAHRLGYQPSPITTITG